MSTMISDFPPVEVEAGEIDWERRFNGVGRLYGAAALERFRSSHVCVIGLGGVGSWTVEALARSAIGRLTLIDLDHVAESNVNRQIQALTDTLGQAKASALAHRITQINPVCQVTQIEEFVEAHNLDQLIGSQKYDFIVDAIDNVPAKIALIAYCRVNSIPIITIGGAGGQIDPTKVEIRDLCQTEQEPLLAKVRKRLRAQHNFPRGSKNKFGIDAVFSMEPLRFPDAGENCAVEQSNQALTGLNCAGFGSSMAVTATFGMVAAAYVLRKLAVGENTLKGKKQ